jgi:hypothetical protein
MRFLKTKRVVCTTWKAKQCVSKVVKVYLADGASDNTIICTYWENLVNVMDLMSDEVGFNTVDFMGTTLERSIGIRADFKFQPSYVNANEIYLHTF